MFPFMETYQKISCLSRQLFVEPKIIDMKTLWVLILVIVSVCVLHAFKAGQKSGISGRITPADGGQRVWAIQGSDSLSLIPTGGSFLIEAKPGLYKILVDAKEPYKDVLMENIEVTNGKTTDVGEIKLTQ
jgi:hypothetical protein